MKGIILFIVLDIIDSIGTFIIGIAMLVGLVYMMNQVPEGKDKPTLGCVGQIMVIILVLAFWFLLEKCS